MFSSRTLMQLYRRLHKAYGPQDWWPAESPFEVIVGAVLTQNTAWTNVEKAIINLRQAGKLSLTAILRLEHAELAALIRPSGYFNIKATRLTNLCLWLERQGGVGRLGKWPTPKLRAGLLSVNGIGPETADDILLYAFNRPVFVIDAYTRRLLVRLGIAEGKEPYETLRAAFEAVLEADPVLYNEYHALIVRHAKQKCSTLPGCLHCGIELPLAGPVKKSGKQPKIPVQGY